VSEVGFQCVSWLQKYAFSLKSLLKSGKNISFVDLK